MTFEEFQATRHDGIRNVYYCGGSLCIYRITGYDDRFSVMLDNQEPVGTLDACERMLFDAYGHEYDLTRAADFEPEPMIAGRGTTADMTILLEEYCAFHKIDPASADELAVDGTIADYHRKWFANFSAIWDDVQEWEDERS